ncbi:MAG: hypothetical protein WCI67_15270 [Chloroflexales bacterium]
MAPDTWDPAALQARLDEILTDTPRLDILFSQRSLGMTPYLTVHGEIDHAVREEQAHAVGTAPHAPGEGAAAPASPGGEADKVGLPPDGFSWITRPATVTHALVGNHR